MWLEYRVSFAFYRAHKIYGINGCRVMNGGGEWGRNEIERYCNKNETIIVVICIRLEISVSYLEN